MNEIVALERGALDRWGNGDPQGYLEIMAPVVPLIMLEQVAAACLRGAGRGAS